VKFVSAPSEAQGQNLLPSAGLQFFGLVDIDGATEQLTVRLMNRDDKELWKITLDPVRAGGSTTPGTKARCKVRLDLFGGRTAWPWNKPACHRVLQRHGRSTGVQGRD
jgi:hypothetical protein